MAGIDADIWVCGDCRSINALRAKQCYRCRTPRDVAAVDPSQIEGTGHGRLRELALPEFRSTRWPALLASAMLILVAVMQVVSTVSDAILFSRVLRDPELLADPAFYQSVEALVAGTVAVATLGVALLALIAWAFWLSRAVMAMPALGLGYPAANGLMAFVENFLPGLNLFRIPAIVRDVMRRLEPGSLKGEALIFAAWIGLFGGYLVPRFGAYLGLLGSGTLEEIVGETLLVQAVATAMVVVGATFLVALIWWIERRIARRRAAQLQEGTAASLASETAPVEASAAAAPIATYRVTEDPEFVAAPKVGPVAGEGVAVEGLAGSPGTIASRAESGTFTSRPITAATGAASTPSEAQAAAPAAMAPAPAAVAPSAEAPIPSPVAPSGEAPTPAAAAPAGEAPAGEAPAGEMPAPPELPAADQAPPPMEDSAVATEPSPATPEPPVEPTPKPALEAWPAVPEPPVEPSPAGADQAAPEPLGDTTTGPQLHLRVENASSMTATMEGESEPITLDELRAAAEALARARGSAVIATVGTSFGALSLAEQAFEVLTDAGVATTVEE